MSYGLTSRFKYPVPVSGSTNWLDLLTHWAELNDVMMTVLSNKDYVISGLNITALTTTLDFSYSSGSVSINGETVSITGGNGSCQADTFNWIYVQSGVIKVGTTPPTGVPYVPIACLQTDDTGVVGHADLRPSPPSLSGISIAPYQVNPTGNINIATGKRIIHADSNVGSNTVMFNNSQTQTIVSWSNQTSAKDWTTISVKTQVPTTAKFAIINLYMATFQADTDGWAVLEVKSSVFHDNWVYNLVDYGHPTANVLNSVQRGQSMQVILPITSEKTFLARSLIDSLGSGAYYASIKILGYVT